ncbi:MAG: hypothetical protein ACFFF4_09540 [Candidatus Thorarchaeota archaeon]
MALTGDKVGIPEAEEAPIVVVPRWKQPLAGIIALIYTFVITMILWWLPMWAGMDFVLNSGSWTLLGGFGLMAVLFAIWFENWPAYKQNTVWKAGLVGTMINIIATLIMLILFTILAAVFYPTNVYAGTAILGAFSGTLFAFGVLWVAGTMYWPFFDKKQPGRGIRVFIIGWIVTLVFWFLLFFPTWDGAVFNLIAYGFSLGWTQWTIFFSLLTLMTFEYWPWNKFGKQPTIGIIAFIVCTILGFVFVYVGGYLGAIAAVIGAALGMSGDLVAATGYMNVALADWLIVAIIAVSLFMDNWPKGNSQIKNFIIRLVLVLVLGLVFFTLFYPLAPLLGFYGPLLVVNPTPFIILMLYIQLLFAYVWRRWPINTEMQ